jgi:hypothetical protein
MSVSAYENQHHFAYLDESGNVEDAFFDGEKWHLQKINNGGATAGPDAAGNLSVTVYRPRGVFFLPQRRQNLAPAANQ